MAHVGSQILEPGQAALVAQRFHGLRRSAGPDSSGPYSLRSPVRPLARILGGQIQVQPQFFLQIAIRPARPKCSEEAVEPLAERGHVTVSLSHP